ncbi:hypothetical protein NDK47_21235 [Brevibacillus ruminantium]|uniref:Uncharacterized protein n=1 Tax=Brevibacillus ruminantium TaxID=2950604 RepID=A0ABY4WC53_9BACL|nr:hypothetical protein [Brevibacillus ruminantium]USG64642.1 hypothetical protein NDK47_21235 [Brevibacillus ruminantium]
MPEQSVSTTYSFDERNRLRSSRNETTGANPGIGASHRTVNGLGQREVEGVIVVLQNGVKIIATMVTS